MSVVSTKNIQIDKIGTTSEGEKTKIQSKDGVYLILGFIPTGRHPTQYTAIDKALDESNGDYLTDARIDLGFYMIPLIYTYYYVSVDAYSHKIKTTNLQHPSKNNNE